MPIIDPATDRITGVLPPPPGSEEAIRRNCLCPRLGEVRTIPGCPLHAEQFNREYSEILNKYKAEVPE